MPYANIHSSPSESQNVGAMSDPVISAALAFSTGLVSLSFKSPPSLLFLLFLLFNSYLSHWVEIMAHEQQNG